MNSNTILAELKSAAEVLNNFINSEQNIQAIETAAELMISSLKNGGKIISCGNGGSSCDAMHFAEELTGRYRENREPIAAISISDPSHITCTANDYGYAFVFSRYVGALGRPGDVLLAISTSGNSENVLKAAEEAKGKGMKVVGLTGKNGGKLAGLADVAINVSHQGFADRIQEVHIKIIHILILLIEKGLAK
ncbi:MAG: D-sedoheptulose 7-phosphate isomerase [Sporocytophaga sp.]|uniref:D-sedoheptulose 7-phosphate isomerase n=1 Tax=Sporocytophaga sp. TaxID=2231183 RepID=UPI001B261E5D|nr:D-sedoheptulose 7-phosphate isomerase [Sporocytophaga sp.]MBO9700036.1 D-sedoheptulose 7-phosphate isomerase [Sporocytophaga sp.]